MPFATAMIGHIVVMLSAIAMLLAGVFNRTNVLDFHTALTIFRDAAWANIAGLALSAIGLGWLVKLKQRRGLVPAFLGILVGGSLCVLTLYWKDRAEKSPRIHDITTDTDHPPEFVAVLPLRKDAPNGVAYPGASVADEQKRAYPDITPIIINLPPERLFAKALDAAKAMHWMIVAEDAASGRIEATDTSAFFGFKDDIVVRVAPEPRGSRLDVRSVSRAGVSDVGSNARRIRAFLERVQNFRG